MKKVINFLKEPFVKNGMGLAFIIGAVIAGIIMVIVEYDNPRFITFIIVFESALILFYWVMMWLMQCKGKSK